MECYYCNHQVSIISLLQTTIEIDSIALLCLFVSSFRFVVSGRTGSFGQGNRLRTLLLCHKFTLVATRQQHGYQSAIW